MATHVALGCNDFKALENKVVFGIDSEGSSTLTIPVRDPTLGVYISNKTPERITDEIEGALRGIKSIEDEVLDFVPVKEESTNDFKPISISGNTTRARSNRSKSNKNILFKEADDTLKRALVSPECRNHIMEIMTGAKPKNGRLSLEWSLSNKEYLEIEDDCNSKLAEYITQLRHEMVARARNLKMDVAEDGAEKEGMQSIPKDQFEEYWRQWKSIDKDLIKYKRLLNTRNDTIRPVVSAYICSIKSYIRHLYGCKFPVVPYSRKSYDELLTIYDQYREEYDLPFPGFPEEHLVKELIMNKELEIIIEVSRLKQMCDIYQKDKQEDMWDAIMASVYYLSHIIADL